MTRAILFIALVTCWLAAGCFSVEKREMKAGLKQALAKAEKYVAEKKLDVSGLFLSKVYRDEFPENPKQNCWIVIWAPKDRNISDGELIVCIYDDGRIERAMSA